MINRSIKHVIKAQKINMGGFIVDQPLPANSVNQIDPFLLLHHAEQRYLSGSNVRDLGVGPHPHRGFSPVTLVFKGAVHHRDSRGNSSIVEAGGTQWMHSGLGIVHSERPSKLLAEQGGIMEIIQFWVNVPRKNKMAVPSYVGLSAANTPGFFSPDKKVRVDVVAGTYEAIKSPIQTYSPLLVLRMRSDADGKIVLKIPKSFNAFIYQLDGRLKINDEQDTFGRQLTWFENDGESVNIVAHAQTRFVLFAGEPIGEKVVAHGPFVMNSDTEILHAMRDYQLGKMGVLIEDFD